VAIAELLRQGFDVYLTLVEDLQIDCVIRQEVDGQPVYLDVQIKARSLKANKRNAGTFAGLEVRKKTGEVRRHPRFDRYRNNFEMLRAYRG